MINEKISFVIPCYRSETVIESVVCDIEKTVKTRPNYDHEIILVNDGSPDNTYDVLQKIAKENKSVKIVNLAKNFGQASAIMAGYHYITGDLIINLDDDGQTNPKELFKLVDKIHEGFDVVYARYPEKKHSLFRNFGTKVNDVMADHFIGKPRDLVFTSYFCTKRFVVDEVLRYDKPFPYIDGLLLRVTNRVCAVEIQHRNREEGESGYTFGKLLSLWLDGFTAFSLKPLRIATVMGFIVAMIGFLYGVVTIIRRIVEPIEETGWASLMAATVFIGGMIMVMLGFVGEYIGRIYISQNNAPQYVVRNTLNVDKTHDE
ncbi:MAG: glycosyltransferase family 2 protein [Eubacterium sp.]